jgi:hypothetical protein
MMTLLLSRLVRRALDFRTASRLLPIVALAASALPAPPQQAAASSPPPAAAPPEVKVQYTGRLFGYYRVEPDTNLDDLLQAYGADVAASKIHSTGPSALLARPGAFLHQRRQNPSDLLLGMGDNFAPEFGASIQQEFSGNPGNGLCALKVRELVPGNWKTYFPESLYKSEARMPVRADCDNVTRFLMAAGYRAVVPGREDFLYTATWLRRIAYLVHGASAPGAPPNPLSGNGPWTVGPVPGKSGNCGSDTCAITSHDHKLHMLAANLRVSVTPPKGAPPKEAKNKSCPLLFATDLGASIECGSSDPSLSAAMDWLARVDAALKPEIRAAIELQTSNHTFATQLLKNELAIFKTIVSQAAVQSALEVGLSASASSGSGARMGCSAINNPLKEILDYQPDPQPALGPTKADKPEKPDRKTSIDVCIAMPALFDQQLNKLKDAMEKAKDKFKAKASPLLEEPDLRLAQRLLLETIYREQENLGFTIAEPSTGQSRPRVLIIGVVGKETMQEVAPDFFRAYPDVYDCPQSTGPRSSLAPPLSPACELHSKAYPPGSDKLTEAAIKKYDPYPVTVGDPLVAAEAVLRAVWAHEQKIDRTILMAQMPATEAEEVGSQLRYDMGAASNPIFTGSDLSVRPRIDLVLSEAQDEHTTGNEAVEINPLRSTVVLSPPLAYESIAKPEWYPPSIATIGPDGGKIPHGIKITNTLAFIDDYAPHTAQIVLPAAVKQRLAATRAQEQEDEEATQKQNNQQGTAANPTSPPPSTAANLLESMLAGKFGQADITPPLLPDLTGPWNECKATANCQNQVLTNYLLHILQKHYETSAAMLKRRDFWFGELASGYDDYGFCDHWTFGDDRAKAYCRLHVALDRVLWRGDYAVRVLLDGSTLTTVLAASSKANGIETTRLANDLHQEWLSTFGVVSDLPTNLVAAAAGPESFSLPGLGGCNATPDPPLGKKTGGTAPTASCVDGFSIASDAAYWIATSAQLAKDQSTYKDIQTFTQKSSHFVATTERASRGEVETFLTTAIASQIIPVLAPHSVAGASSPPPKDTYSAQDDLARIEAASQKRRLMQFDISKFAAGYSFTAPSIDDTDLGNDLSGVTNTQATTPHSSELDLEAAGRTVTAPVLRPGLVFGVQNDLEFDHKRTGNTSGKPATVSYQLNSETVGGFAQIHIPQVFGKKDDDSLTMQGPRDVPRFYWVIAPYQYQRQIVGSPLYFGYLTPPYTKNPPQQLTVTIPVSDGFSWKSGLRFEAGGFKQAWAPDSGSYAELGPEYVIQNKILYAIAMPDLSGLSSPVTTHCTNPCPVTAAISITSAVAAYYKDNNQTLNGSSHLKPQTRTVHAGGLYWTAHVQKVLTKSKTYSVSFDTAGDSYLLPGFTLPTQTRYAINNKLAFNMNFLGNLSFSPTYSVFNYENQDQPAKRIPLNTTSFQVMLKWYYGRDTESPPMRLLWFSGPKSGDQTGSTKMK